MMCDSRAASFCTASSNLLHKRNEKEVEVTEDNLEIIIITTNYKADLQSQTKVVGRVLQLNSSPDFNPPKGEFSLLLNIPRAPYSMLGYNRTITRTNISVLLNIGQGAGGGRKKKEVKKATFPTLLTMIVAYKGRRFSHSEVEELEKSF